MITQSSRQITGRERPPEQRSRAKRERSQVTETAKLFDFNVCLTV